MAGNNTIEAKLKIAADFADAVKQLKALRAEMQGAKADARAVGTTSGAAAPAQAQKETAAAARSAASERTRAAREASAAEQAAAREATATARRERQAEVEAARAAAREKKRLAAEVAAAEGAAAKAARQERLRAGQLAPQVTDIVTGLASGQNPLLVAIQQGGQLRDIYGSGTGALKAMLSVFTPMRLALGGVVGVAGLLAKAFFDARAESDNLNRAITSTGNIAATTVGQVNTLAREIAAAQRVSVGSVRDSLAALAESGQYTGATLGKAGAAVTAFSRATGRSTDEALKLFDGMGSGVSAWAAKVNQQYNFITAAQYARIRALEAEGRQQEAMRLALDTFAGTMEQRVVPSTNALARAWSAVGREAAGAWEKLKGLFEDQTPEQKLKALTDRLAELRRMQDARSKLPPVEAARRGDLGPEIERVEAMIDGMRRVDAMDAVRRQERAAAAQTEQAEIVQQSARFQDALAALSAAGAQKALAAELALLDKRRSAVESEHQRGLLSELDYNLQLNAIEQQRLRAQAANMAKQIEIEQGKPVADPAEALGRDARVSALQAQLIGLRSQIDQAVSAARTAVENDQLKDSQEKAQKWAATWQKAADAIKDLKARNAADGAQRGDATADPATRAQAAADAAEAALREQFRQAREGLELQISLDIPEERKAELRKQLEKLIAELDEAARTAGQRAQAQSLRDQAAALQAELRQKEADIERAAADGGLTSAEAERELLALRAGHAQQLTRILALLQEIAATDGDRAGVARLRKDIDGLTSSATELERTMRGSVASSFSQAFQDFATGAKSAGDAFKDFLANIARAALSFIAQRMGEQLAKSLIPSGSGSGGDSGGMWATFANWVASLFHGGGVVGGVQGMARSVSPMLFATAARYHSGGIAGLAPDEVPAVLRRGEEVITEDDPRHRANGGRTAIGNLNVNVSVNTGGGVADGDAQRLGEGLGRAMRRAAEDYVVEQLRPGGLLAGR